MSHRKFFIPLLLLLFNGLSAQQTFYYSSDDRLYLNGVELYKNGKYSAAQQFFDRYLNEHNGENSDYVSGSSYYGAMCAVKLFNNDAESRIIRFLNENPENPYKNDALFNLAGFYYQRKNYNSALKYYELVDKSHLSETDRPEYYFKTGYCFFLKENYDQARLAFSQIKDLDTKYTSPAVYYYSHINYEQGNMETALEGFERLKNDANFGPIVPYYLTQIYYKQKKYNEVVQYAPALMENVTEKREPEVARIIGESYVQLNLYKDAVPYLEKYHKIQGTVSREDKYSLAFAYYKTGDYEKAANLFGQITGSDSELGQNALYHLADCHIRLGDKNKARMAFSSAANMNYNTEIAEDALFNFALLTCELDYSPFNESVDALNVYLEKYPNSSRTDEVNNYLVMAYMNAKNYRLALASIEKIRNKNPEIQKAYQKIAFYRGLELYSNMDYSGAIKMLNSANKYGIADMEIYARNNYWTGEAYFRTGDYVNAVESYKKFLSQSGVSSFKEYPLAHYNLGYAYFSLKQYNDAATWLQKFISLSAGQSRELVADANSRLGDCYFVQKQYQTSISYYTNAAASGGKSNDYALLQKALALGVLGRDNEKITALNQLLNSYPNSAYKADANYQLGESYVKLSQPERAIDFYKKVVESYPQSSYVKKSLLNLGLIYYNANRNSEAITCYRKVVEDYAGSDEASNALIGLKNVYIDNNDVDGYYTYINNKGIITSSDLVEQDSLSFISAERLYMSGDYNRAKQSLTNYINNHPRGRFILNAQFYKGDCCYRANEFDEAMISFDYIIEQPKSKFTESALLGASRIRFSQKQYNEATVYFLKLEEVAEVRSNIVEARMGLLRSYNKIEDFGNVIETADRILLSEKLSPEQERETRFAKAGALMARDRQMLALEEFLKLSSEVKSTEGAESKYRVAEIYYKRNEKDKAEKTITEFADKTTPHQYWMAKSYLLWADIFRDKGDDFQALQTLQSLIEYYENSDDGILNEATGKKKQITDRQNANQVKPDTESEEINIEE